MIPPQGIAICHCGKIALVVLWQRRDGTTAVELPILGIRAKLKIGGGNLELPKRLARLETEYEVQWTWRRLREG